MVVRISETRTAFRSSISRARFSGLKPSRRVHSPTYGARGDCACMPTRRSIASAAASFQRRRSICRSSRARLSALRSRTSGVTACALGGPSSRRLLLSCRQSTENRMLPSSSFRSSGDDFHSKAEPVHRWSGRQRDVRACKDSLRGPEGGKGIQKIVHCPSPAPKNAACGFQLGPENRNDKCFSLCPSLRGLFGVRHPFAAAPAPEAHLGMRFMDPFPVLGVRPQERIDFPDFRHDVPGLAVDSPTVDPGAEPACLLPARRPEQWPHRSGENAARSRPPEELSCFQLARPWPPVGQTYGHVDGDDCRGRIETEEILDPSQDGGAALSCPQVLCDAQPPRAATVNARYGPGSHPRALSRRPGQTSRCRLPWSCRSTR